jgi:Mg2+/Co2+ transporter CorB
LQIDAFTLLNNALAAVMTLHARKITAILYHLKEANLSLTKFLSIQVQENIYFVYKKQSSKTAIANYQNNKTKI